MAYCIPAIVAVPKPSFPARCKHFSRSSLAAFSSHHFPVPSGLLSSITSTSACGATSQIASTNRGRFSISLYVATVTSVFGMGDSRAPIELHGPPQPLGKSHRGLISEHRLGPRNVSQTVPHVPCPLWLKNGLNIRSY